MRLLSLITRKRDKNHHTVSKMRYFLHKYTCMQTHTTSTPTVKHSLFPFKHFSCVSNRSCLPNPSIQIYKSFNEIKRVNISLFQDKHEQLKGTKQKMQRTCTEGLEQIHALRDSLTFDPRRFSKKCSSNTQLVFFPPQTLGLNSVHHLDRKT